ncbi:MAG: PEGA domain-containing protein [Pirellulaceae bacterium]|nr:PEGA domain-containing protein [Planctomycetales bacterium]
MNLRVTTKRPSILPWLVLLLGLLALSATGCVRRRLTIRSNPPGALVYIDEQEIGRTPIATSFTYYGTRRIRLVKDGYETVTALEKVPPPWYQIPPLDFVSENLVPREIRDERYVDFNLVPQRVVPTQELLGRAQQLRTSSQAGMVVPLPPNASSPTDVR